MPSVLLPLSFSSSSLGPAQLMLERAEKWFRRSRHPVSHTLRIASGGAPADQMPRGRQTRFIPCAWGVRRDDYRWHAGGGRRDWAALHQGAAAIGWALVHAPLPGWKQLLPGTMAEVMGKSSDLYLADYWLLTLHYLVWSKRLPYPIKARWLCGQSVHDACFDFVSRLPAGVAEASQDALILFRETALLSIGADETAVEVSRPVGSNCISSVEPPIYRHGRWCMVEGEQARAKAPQMQLEAQDQPVLPAPLDALEESSQPTLNEQPVAVESNLLELDDQAFTARCSANVCRFGSRNKQLFALLERINRRPGHRVSFEDLCAPGDVWDGLTVEDSTIRGAVARLRKRLKEHGMAALAGRIATGSYRGSRYVVLRSAEDQEN